MKQSLNVSVQSSEFSEVSGEFDQPKDKEFVLNHLCLPSAYKDSTNCRICDQKMKEKSYCEFCGKSVCRTCLIKKRKDPEFRQTWHKICQKCELKYLASILQLQIAAEKQNINIRIENEQQLLENQRELLFNLKNNVEVQSSQQDVRSAQLKRQEIDADLQINFLESEVQEQQIEKEMYLLFKKQTRNIQQKQDVLQLELNKKQQQYNDLQFELKRINQQIKIVETQIQEQQQSIENNLNEVEPNKKAVYKESFLPEAASSGYEGIFRESSFQQTLGDGLLQARPISKEQQTQQRPEKNEKDCLIF